MSSKIERLFFCDVESTGIAQIDGRPGAIMEFAWTITDPAGEQITPLNSVFTALPTEPGQTVDFTDADAPFPHYLAAHPEGTYGEHSSWDRGATYPSDFVKAMHDGSGLSLDWSRAATLRPLSIVDTWAELERLIEGDLSDAGWYDSVKASWQLAGDGVAHYEHTFLRVMAQRVFASPRFHYRTHDVSQILNGLATANGGKTPGNVGRLVERHAHEADGVRAWSFIELGPHYTATDLGGGSRRGNVSRPGWVAATDIPHRGAADVARTLMGHRLLPRLVA